MNVHQLQIFYRYIYRKCMSIIGRERIFADNLFIGVLTCSINNLYITYKLTIDYYIRYNFLLLHYLIVSAYE